MATGNSRLKEPILFHRERSQTVRHGRVSVRRRLPRGGLKMVRGKVVSAAK